MVIQACLRGCLSCLVACLFSRLLSVASLGYIVIPSTGGQFRETSEIKKLGDIQLGGGDQSRQCSGFFGA